MGIHFQCPGDPLAQGTPTKASWGGQGQPECHTDICPAALLSQLNIPGLPKKGCLFSLWMFSGSFLRWSHRDIAGHEKIPGFCSVTDFFMSMCVRVLLCLNFPPFLMEILDS